jgi:hypothetical protein
VFVYLGQGLALFEAVVIWKVSRLGNGLVDFMVLAWMDVDHGAQSMITSLGAWRAKGV